MNGRFVAGPFHFSFGLLPALLEITAAFMGRVFRFWAAGLLFRAGKKTPGRDPPGSHGLGPAGLRSGRGSGAEGPGWHPGRKGAVTLKTPSALSRPLPLPLPAPSPPSPPPSPPPPRPLPRRALQTELCSASRDPSPGAAQCSGEAAFVPRPPCPLLGGRSSAPRAARILKKPGRPRPEPQPAAVSPLPPASPRVSHPTGSPAPSGGPPNSDTATMAACPHHKGIPHPRSGCSSGCASLLL